MDSLLCESDSRGRHREIVKNDFASQHRIEPSRDAKRDLTALQCSDLLYEIHRSHRWKVHRKVRAQRIKVTGCVLYSEWVHSYLSNAAFFFLHL